MATKNCKSGNKDMLQLEILFNFCISVYDSWHEDADLYESHEREDSFVSLARKFANDNALMYFPSGFIPPNGMRKTKKESINTLKSNTITKILTKYVNYGIYMA